MRDRARLVSRAVSDERQHRAAERERVEASLDAEILPIERQLRSEHEAALEELRDIPIEGPRADEVRETLQSRAHELRPMLDAGVAELRVVMGGFLRRIIDLDLDDLNRADEVAEIALIAEYAPRSQRRWARRSASPTNSGVAASAEVAVVLE